MVQSSASAARRSRIASSSLTWRSLAMAGNLSSASVLHVLCEALDEGIPSAGETGVLLALGPGFGAELALLRF
jgi:alkylresorcinol/alkylpyrone synthase